MFPFKVQDELLRVRLKEHFPKGPVYSRIDQLDYRKLDTEDFLRVNGSSIIYANYKVILNDFPYLKEEMQKKQSDEGFDQKNWIDTWLLKNTSYISKAQAKQTDVNSTINFSKESVQAYRPGTYGRAAIFQVDGISESKSDDAKGLLDVKGVGVIEGKSPSFTSHRNGLLMLEEAIDEYVNQQLIQGIFLHAQREYETLPIYAIVDLGFKVKRHKLRDSRACLLVRRAHTRPANKGGLPKFNSSQQKMQLDIEKLLRKYGITSTNRDTTISVWKETGKLNVVYGRTKMTHLKEDQLQNIEDVSRLDGEPLFFEGVNVQHTGEYEFNSEKKHCQLVDFGSYNRQTVYKNAILSLVSDKLMRWGGSIFPESKKFPQPEPSIAVPEEYWGKSTEVFGFETEYGTSRKAIVCEGISQAYCNDMLDKNTMIDQLDAYLQTATMKWKDAIMNSKSER